MITAQQHEVEGREALGSGTEKMYSDYADVQQEFERGTRLTDDESGYDTNSGSNKISNFYEHNKVSER